MKKMNNKGFSLVELIVVVAIMAVLIGVLAPQYLRYVEKSRLQKDNAALGEVANAIKIACADETINNAVGSMSSVSYTFNQGTANSFPSTNCMPLDVELQKALKEVKLGSNTYNYPVTIMVTVSGGKVDVETDDWMETPDATSTTKTF